MVIAVLWICRVFVGACLPRNVLMVLECKAYRNSSFSSLHIESISHWVPSESYHYSQAFKVCGLFLISSNASLTARLSHCYLIYYNNHCHCILTPFSLNWAFVSLSPSSINMYGVRDIFIMLCYTYFHSYFWCAFTRSMQVELLCCIL